jgi:hypothetical protein
MPVMFEEVTAEVEQPRQTREEQTRESDNNEPSPLTFQREIRRHQQRNARLQAD